MSRKYVLAATGLAALGAAAMGRRGDWKDHATRRQHSTAMRYDSAADEAWVAFFSADHPTDEGLRLGKQFRDRIKYLLYNKFNYDVGVQKGLLPPNPDLDSIAYLSYGSHAGHGIGLWEGDEPWHSAFEKVVMSDKQARDIGYRLDEEVHEGLIAAGEVDPSDYEGSSARGRGAAYIKRSARGRGAKTKSRFAGMDLTAADFRPRTREGFYKRGKDIIYIYQPQPYRTRPGSRPLGPGDWWVDYVGTLTEVDKSGPTNDGVYQTSATSGGMKLYEFTSGEWRRMAPSKLNANWRAFFKRAGINPSKVK